MILLIIATGNAHKVEEIRAALSSEDQFTCRSLKDLPAAPKALEDAPTFAGNATKKSLNLAAWLAAEPRRLVDMIGSRETEEVYCLADDSGLEVDALHGAPGVHSARFAALETSSGNSSDQANNEKLLQLLAAVPSQARSARFRCVIALTPVLLAGAEPASSVCAAQEAELLTELFEGCCQGRIAHEPRGRGGFGYDPLFIPNGYTQSFAELGEEVKSQISHRAHALHKVKTWFEERA